MAVGDGAGAQRSELDRHHLAVKQTENAAQRPYPADLVVAPAHRLRPRKAGEQDGIPASTPRPSICRRAGAGDMHPALPVVRSSS